MLYYLFTYLDQAYDIPGAGVFQYITFPSRNGGYYLIDHFNVVRETLDRQTTTLSKSAKPFVTLA
jgi:hypothetical protein